MSDLVSAAQRLRDSVDALPQLPVQGELEPWRYFTDRGTAPPGEHMDMLDLGPRSLILGWGDDEWAKSRRGTARHWLSHQQRGADMTDDLRQRLDEALTGKVSASFLVATNQWSFAVDPSMVDAALAVFAAWLRERADRADEGVAMAREHMAESPDDLMIRLGGATIQGAAGALRKAADEIAPTSSTEQERVRE